MNLFPTTFSFFLPFAVALAAIDRSGESDRARSLLFDEIANTAAVVFAITFELAAAAVAAEGDGVGDGADTDGTEMLMDSGAALRMGEDEGRGYSVPRSSTEAEAETLFPPI